MYVWQQVKEEYNLSTIKFNPKQSEFEMFIWRSYVFFSRDELEEKKGDIRI